MKLFNRNNSCLIFFLAVFSKNSFTDRVWNPSQHSICKSTQLRVLWPISEIAEKMIQNPISPHLFDYFSARLMEAPFSNTFAYVMQLIKSFSGRWSVSCETDCWPFSFDLWQRLSRGMFMGRNEWFFFALPKFNLHRHSRVLALPKKHQRHEMSNKRTKRFKSSSKKLSKRYLLLAKMTI